MAARLIKTPAAAVKQKHAVFWQALCPMECSSTLGATKLCLIALRAIELTATPGVHIVAPGTAQDRGVCLLHDFSAKMGSTALSS